MSSDEEVHALRVALEKSQQENKELHRLVEALAELDQKKLVERVEELRVRLERADEVRVEWDARMHALRRELEIALKEQERLRTVLENERLTR